ncbi:MAG TPA: hypothetical protein VFR85_03565 [Anaeromyxobacteraceae bacterium]|nr:hypothetical protein [Anaeromyxobacteraceae bacterium]
MLVAVVAALLACGVKAPPRPPEKAGAQAPGHERAPPAAADGGAAVAPGGADGGAVRP